MILLTDILVRVISRNMYTFNFTSTETFKYLGVYDYHFVFQFFHATRSPEQYCPPFVSSVVLILVLQQHYSEEVLFFAREKLLACYVGDTAGGTAEHD